VDEVITAISIATAAAKKRVNNPAAMAIPRRTRRR